MKQFLLSQVLLLFCSCGFVNNFSGKSVELAGDMVVKEISLSSFSSIESSIPITIIYSDGAQKLTAAMPEDAFQYVEFNVKSNILHIESKSVNLRGLNKAVITLSLPQLEGVTINGSGKFTADQGMRSSSFAAKINGSGDIDVTRGRIEELDIKINGSGNIRFASLNSDNTYIKINGSGNVELDGNSDEVEVKINGSGNINLRGLKTQSINTSINGSGKVISK